MHRLRVIVAAGVLAAAFIAPVGCGGDSPAQPSGISGSFITRAAFGGVLPLEGGSVSVRDPDTRRIVAEAKSGVDGTYFVPLAAGDYEVCVSFGRGRPVWSPVAVRAGRVTTLAQFEDSAGSFLKAEQAAEPRLHVIADRAARALHLRRYATAHVCGTTIGGAEPFFGTAGSSSDTRVWILYFEDEPTADAPADERTRALREGGYVAYEIDASTFEVLATTSDGTPWSGPPQGKESMWGGGEAGFSTD